VPGNRELSRTVAQRLRWRLKGLIDPAPQVPANKQLLPQQRHEPGEAPAEARPQLRELHHHDGNPY